MGKTKIEWTLGGHSWNPTTGCTKKSPGRLAATRLKHLPQFANGFFRNVQLHPDRLHDPFSWKKPGIVFVNSMSDLFHEDIPFTFIDQVFEVMIASPHLIFIILTKESRRQMEYMQQRYGESTPPANVWLFVSVEDQPRYDERARDLLNTPAAVRGISMEPLISEIDMTRIPLADAANRRKDYPGIDVVFLGGESGPKARPMHPEWVNRALQFCERMGIPFFFKQWGEYSPGETSRRVRRVCLTRSGRLHVAGPMPKDAVILYRHGKKAAGRTLNGKIYNGLPKKGMCYGKANCNIGGVVYGHCLTCGWSEHE